MSAFTSDKFKFLGLEMNGAEVLARVQESQGPFSKPVHSVDEEDVHRWLERTVELIRLGQGGKIARKNQEELTAAFNAIRTHKAQNGILLSVKTPCI
jgi:hypothetical protein